MHARHIFGRKTAAKCCGWVAVKGEGIIGLREIKINQRECSAGITVFFPEQGQQGGLGDFVVQKLSLVLGYQFDVGGRIVEICRFSFALVIFGFDLLLTELRKKMEERRAQAECSSLGRNGLGLSVSRRHSPKGDREVFNTTCSIESVSKRAIR